jgi:hypothetical protein
MARRREVPGRAPLERSSKSIAQFCRDHDICRQTFSNWRKQGLAPAVIQVAGPRGRVLITAEAEAAWRERHSELVPA